MIRARPLVAAILLACIIQAAASDDPAPTVGSITRNNGLATNDFLLVHSPSILRVVPSNPLPANPRLAIEQYDRLLELSPDPDIRAEALRRSADLRVQLNDSEAGANDAELRKAIDSYKILLADFPSYERSDRVLYQLARAYQLSGDTNRAIDSLRMLVQKYPTSARADDAAFRAAEWLYAGGRYNEAEPLYQAVINAKAGTTLSEAAQYKYGWSLFKQTKYEQALPVFLAMLDHYLPPGELTDPVGALASVARNRAQFATEALRVSCLSLAAMGGGKAANDYFDKTRSEPRYFPLLYSALGSLMLEKHRYTDAAEAYAAFITRHPDHALAPDFQIRVIAAYEKGGFNDLVVGGKETYVMRYAPGTPYWSQRTPPPAVMAELSKDLDELGHYYQAKAQQAPAAEASSRQADFIKAAGWYRRSLEIFPAAPKSAETRMLLADALYDGGKTREAAEQYSLDAYTDTSNVKAPEAAYAAVQAYQRLAHEVPTDAQADALRHSINASLKLADRFPQHPQLLKVLARAANDLYAIKDYERSVAVATRILQQPSPLPAELRLDALTVIADSRFSQQQYPQAEEAYTELFKSLPPGDARYHPALEQLAASVYKQGEAARNTGDLRTAALTFQRVSRVAPGASIIANADYDAAAAYMVLQDWPDAETALEDFRQRFPAHALIAGADKKLALAYQKNNQPAQAAEAYARISQRDSEALPTRRDAAWLAAQLYDQAGDMPKATNAYEAYIGSFPHPLDRAMKARRRLADFALADNHDDARHLYWLNEIIRADGSAGTERTDATELLAAQAWLELGRIDAGKARALVLTAPFSKSLPRRKILTEVAIANLDHAAGYGFAEVTTAATYEIGLIYRDLGNALLDSQRPAELTGEALEQYNLLLEEQADPFDEKAVATHVANLQRMRQGLWNGWIGKSADALAELAPAIYGKHEQRESSYDSIH